EGERTLLLPYFAELGNGENRYFFGCCSNLLPLNSFLIFMLTSSQGFYRRLELCAAGGGIINENAAYGDFVQEL
ncbi:MAG: hypothetical protein D3924_01410, partial [Candidatus Electrothrix sp. AR4]|nr:hypothetical protein [Candidatus Electrothrix sp. AR4]